MRNVCLKEVPVLGRRRVGLCIRAEELMPVGVEHPHEDRQADPFHAAAQDLAAQFGTDRAVLGELQQRKAVARANQGEVDVGHDAARVQRQRCRQAARVTAQVVDRSLTRALEQKRNDHADGHDERHTQRVA